MITNNQIYNFLLENKDNKYKDFSSSLIPGNHNLIGVRLPILRNYAKILAKENNMEDYLNSANSKYFEEIMLQGLAIGYSKENVDNIIKYCKIFVPKIDNWSVCDSFCNTLKIAQKYPDKMLKYLLSYTYSNKTYELRFLLIMLLSHYINNDYIDIIFETLPKIKEIDYYVQMAIAWLLSVCYIKYPTKTLKYLKYCTLSDFTYNKAIQKMLESFRISNEDKTFLKNLKR